MKNQINSMKKKMRKKNDHNIQITFYNLIKNIKTMIH